MATTGHPFRTDSTLPRETYLDVQFMMIMMLMIKMFIMMIMMFMMAYSPNCNLTRSFFLSTIFTTPYLSISPMSPVLNHLRENER